MSPNSKLPVIILVVLILASLVTAGTGLYLLQKEKVKNAILQEDLADVKAQLSVTETKLRQSQDDVAALGQKLQESSSQIEMLMVELDSEKSGKEDALKQVDALKSELEEQKKLKGDLEKDLTQAQAQLTQLQNQAKDLESKKGELESRIKALESQSVQQDVELGKIVVGSENPSDASGAIQAEPSAPIDEGKVLLVNKDYNFAVINLGSNQGVSLDNIFSVYHDGAYVGDVKIEKVHPTMSAAGFLSEDIKGKVSEGDKVLRK